MRQAIGTTWILQLVIIFMLIFVAFLSLSLNYTKAFKIKNEIITTIEKYEGLTSSESKTSPGSIKIINNYLLYNHYGTMGECETGSFGSSNLESTTLEPAEKGTKFYYCVSKIDRSNRDLPSRAQYEIQIFFKFSLPVIGDLFTFTAEGSTIDINRPVSDIDFLY